MSVASKGFDSSQIPRAAASSSYLNDKDFQDELLRHLISDSTALGKIAPLISADDFNAAPHHRIVSQVVLEHWRRERKPLGRLITAEVKQIVQRKGLNHDKATDLLALVERLESTQPSASLNAIIDRLYEAKQDRRTTKTIERMIDLHGEGQLTPAKMEELARQSKWERPETRTTAAIDLGDILYKDFQPRPKMLQPILPVRGLMMIHGFRGLGKSHIALGIGLACATPARFLYWQARKQYRVVYVAGEMSGAENKSMLKRMLWGTMKNAVQFPEGSKNEPRDLFTHSLSMIIASELEFGVPDLATREGRDWLENDSTVRRADFLILDNVSSLHRKGDEREQKGWNEMNEWLMHLKSNSVGKSVLLIHHDGKNPEQRGTSFREDILDTVIHLKEPKDMKQGQSVHCEIHTEKMRGYSPGDPACEPFVARLIPDPENGDAMIWSFEPLRVANMRKAFRLFDAGMSIKDVTDGLGISRATAFRYQREYRDRSED